MEKKNNEKRFSFLYRKSEESGIVETIETDDLSESARNKVGYVIDEEGNLCYLRRGPKKLEENKKNESLYSR